MTDEQQPELRWAPIPPKPRNRGRIWLIVGLVVAAVVIVGVLLLFLIPRGDAPDPDPSPSPSATPTSTPTPTPTPTPEPTEPPVATAPPVADPTLDAFRTQVGAWLEDGSRGLDIVSGVPSSDAISVVETLQEDAQRLSDAQPPSSIAAAWRDGVSAYAQRLADLNTAVASGSDTAGAVDAARSALQTLNGIVGL